MGPRPRLEADSRLVSGSRARLGYHLDRVSLTKDVLDSNESGLAT